MRAHYGPVENAISQLTGLLGDRLATTAAVREHHGHDESGFKPLPPDAVAFAQSTEEVSEIIKICAQHSVPIIAYGTGTAIEGHVQAIHGGICIDMGQMDQILRVNQEDLDCTVQAGVTRLQLESHLRDTGLFFPVDPGADASLGGMAATSASGTNAVRYGTMKENVLSLTVVLADGRIIKTGTRAKKSSAGYDLTHLFIGSEGTLGIITEITLRLHGLQEAISSAVCSFPTVDDAINMVILTIQSGIPIARIELLDALMMHAINRYSKTDYPEQPHLFLEFHGSEAGVIEQAEAVQQIASDFNGSDFTWATLSEDRNRLWKARHDAYPSALQLQPGTQAITTDVCVPISRLAECIRETRKDIDAASMPIVMLGHVGDGNFHLAILPHPDHPEEIEEAEALNHRLVRRALAMDGTCSGEHGIGQGKIRFLEEQNPEGVVLMRQIKQAMDPHNLLNPGKVLRMD
ncbi:FAD-binding oxidoreductase [Sedimenticola selenatireducens]|uniref:D-lactate dehydrogenase (cytochrome) n=1 Tax=Sedimenticola selenatireducens TaxID=191960 RepID=A0A558DT61_9GAMM|nr:FAD-linked oxidase C-terminal domain-containing protein [Sedimenticola selenatireducens]TVO76784.1 FAD-binding protein [Sedimenticola selenatireducens]TVT64227.1 MAG: FAD-binding protein [Sedimenticola selenatireducens]